MTHGVVYVSGAEWSDDPWVNNLLHLWQIYYASRNKADDLWLLSNEGRLPVGELAWERNLQRFRIAEVGQNFAQMEVAV